MVGRIRVDLQRPHLSFTAPTPPTQQRRLTRFKLALRTLNRHARMFRGGWRS